MIPFTNTHIIPPDLAGEQTPPQIYFLRAVDVVLSQDAAEPSVPGELPLPQRAGEKKIGDTPR